MSLVVAAPVSPPRISGRSIDVTFVRELDVVSHPEGRPPHLGGASGVVRAGRSTYVVSDDENHLAVFGGSPAGGSGRVPSEPGRFIRVFPGALPLDPDKRRALRPDIESITTVPPLPQLPNGALMGVGSGSGQSRNRGFLWELGQDGEPVGTPRTIDLSSMYSTLKKHVPGDLNIEGAVVQGGTLRLFQRGNSLHGRNMIVDVALSRALQSITATGRIDGSAISSVREYDLGKLRGVPLTFADARALKDGSIAYLATAERTDSATGDGAVVGSTLGVINLDGSLGPAWKIDAPGQKFEGIDVLSTDGSGVARHLGPGVHAILVTDADDPAQAARLYSGDIPA